MMTKYKSDKLDPNKVLRPKRFILVNKVYNQ